MYHIRTNLNWFISARYRSRTWEMESVTASSKYLSQLAVNNMRLGNKREILIWQRQNEQREKKCSKCFVDVTASLRDLIFCWKIVDGSVHWKDASFSTPFYLLSPFLHSFADAHSFSLTFRPALFLYLPFLLSSPSRFWLPLRLANWKELEWGVKLLFLVG